MFSDLGVRTKSLIAEIATGESSEDGVSHRMTKAICVVTRIVAFNRLSVSPSCRETGRCHFSRKGVANVISIPRWDQSFTETSTSLFRYNQSLLASVQTFIRRDINWDWDLLGLMIGRSVGNINEVIQVNVFFVG